MLITFSGLDGAGKSTLIALLRQRLELDGRSVRVLTMYDHVGLYAAVRAVRDRLAGHGAPASTDTDRLGGDLLPGRPASLGLKMLRHPGIKRIVYVFDLLLFVGYRLLLERCLGRVLILDRYFYDSLADVADGRRWVFVKAFLRLLPRPDVAVFVDVPAEVAFARKQEYPLDYLRERRRKYVKIFEWLDQPLIIANVDAQKAADRVYEASMKRSGMAR